MAIKVCASLIAVAALSGCASSTELGAGKTWEDGWRRATVSSVNDELRWYQRASCGKAAAPGDKYVSLSYRVVGQTRGRVIPMAAQAAPAPASKVLLNVNTCELVPAP